MAFTSILLRALNRVISNPHLPFDADASKGCMLDHGIVLQCRSFACHKIQPRLRTVLQGHIILHQGFLNQWRDLAQFEMPVTGISVAPDLVATHRPGSDAVLAEGHGLYAHGDHCPTHLTNQCRIHPNALQVEIVVLCYSQTCTRADVHGSE